MEKKILIVDDEADIREMLTEALEMSGYEVFAATTSDEALEILSNESIQVMFFDLYLGNESTHNGVDLCIEVRKNYPIACIYAVTGHVSMFELSDCREAGFDDYFTKPIDLALLFKTAAEAFDKLERWRRKGESSGAN